MARGKKSIRSLAWERAEPVREAVLESARRVATEVAAVHAVSIEMGRWYPLGGRHRERITLRVGGKIAYLYVPLFFLTKESWDFRGRVLSSAEWSRLREGIIRRQLIRLARRYLAGEPLIRWR